MAGPLTHQMTESGSALRVAFGSVGVSVVTVLPVFLTAGLAVQMGNDLDFPSSSLGVAPAAFFGAMVFGSTIAGRLVERVGPVRAIRVIVLCVAILMLVIAGTASSLAHLAFYLAIAGFLNSLAQPATNQLLARRVPRTKQGLAYGAKYSAIPVASLASGLAVPALGLTLGWRWAFSVFAVLAVVMMLYPFGQPRHQRGSAPIAFPDVGLPRRALFGLAVGISLAAAGGSTLAIFMVASAVDTGWSEGSAGYLLAAASVLGVISRLLSGLQADRRDRNHLLVVSVMLLAGAVGTLAMAAPNIVVFAVGAPLAFAAGWGWPGVFILAVVNLHSANPAAATAITQIGTSAGCVVGPLMFGHLVDVYSFSVAWVVNALVLVAAALILLVIRRRVLLHLATVPPESIPWRRDHHPIRQGNTHD